MEKRHGERMFRAAEAEHELWHEVFRDRRLVWRWLLGGSIVATDENKPCKSPKWVNLYIIITL